MGASKLAADAASANLSFAAFVGATGIAIVASLVIAGIEIPNKSKAPIRACLGAPSIFYLIILSFGNVVTTLLASLVVVKLPAALSPYNALLCPFFGVFGFEAILKNTNVTMFDRGVLTIQDWTDKALNGAAAAAISKQEDLKEEQELKLTEILARLSEPDINTRVLEKMGAQAVRNLEAAAEASKADAKQYKILQLIAALSRSEALALIKSAKTVSTRG